MKSGENGKGLRSRWYPQTLHNRIWALHRLRDRLAFHRGDGLEVLQAHRHRQDVIYFIDPPYTVAGGGKRAGRRLYTHHVLDHGKLFSLAAKARGEFLMTYENSEEVRALAHQHGFAVREVCMKSGHHARLTELLISKPAPCTSA